MRTPRVAVLLMLASLAFLYGARVSAQTRPEEADGAINPDRPGLAEGSGVIGRGRLQIETGYQDEYRDDNANTETARFFPTLVRIGLSDRWEARIEGNTFTRVSTLVGRDALVQTSGLAPISVGAKFHFRDSNGRQPSLGTIVRIFPPSGSGRLRSDHATGDVRLAADWDVTPSVSLNPNVGVAFSEDDGGHRFAAGLIALTVGYVNQAKTLNPFIDIGIQAPEEPGAGSSIIVDGGLAYVRGRNLQLDVSAGVGSHGRTPPQRFISVGLSVRLRAGT